MVSRSDLYLFVILTLDTIKSGNSRIMASYDEQNADDPDEHDIKFLNPVGFRGANSLMNDALARDDASPAGDVVTARGRELTFGELMAIATHKIQTPEMSDHAGRTVRCVITTVENGVMYRYKFGLLADGMGQRLMHKACVVQHQNTSAVRCLPVLITQ